MSDAIRGKWTNEKLKVDGPLGSGANGEVYLVRTARGTAALKVATTSADIALEWGVLSSLKDAAIFPKPMFIDDDAVRGLFFYVMEFVPGRPLSEMLKNLSENDMFDIGNQILGGLYALHSTGHAFCDVKPENILLAERPVSESKMVRFVDVGGITPFGRAVRQFTPYYDRAFWGLGSRLAEPTYDMTAFALLFLCNRAVTLPVTLHQMNPTGRLAMLQKCMKQFPWNAYSDVFRRIFAGEYADISAVQGAWRAAHDLEMRQAQTAKQRASRRAPRKSHQTQRKRVVDWTEWLMWMSLSTALVVTFAAWGSFLGWF